MTPTVLLLPGNMCDARLWRGGDDRLRTALTERGLLSVIDCALCDDASISAMAQRALAQCDGRVLPIGFSMGAIVAVEMAAIAPERIAGLVLAGYNATADLPERAAHRPVQQAEVRAGGLERVLVEELKPNYLAAANRGNAPLLALLRDMGLGLGSDMFIAQSEALRLRGDRRALLPSLNMPVLYACGAEDTLCPPAWHAEWAAMTPAATLRSVAGAGHMLPLENVDGFMEVVSTWLTSNKSIISRG